MTAAREDVQAVAKTVHVSARKARLVVDQIRNRSVPEARTILAFSTRAAARDVEKVLRSAVANGYIKHGWDGDELYIKAAYVDEGVTIKRWRARARGRVNRIFKRTCHITIKLDRLENIRPATQPSSGGKAKATRSRKGGAPGGAAAPAKPKRSQKKKEAAV
jgi:large subunit ribosomal protein L22